MADLIMNIVNHKLSPADETKWKLIRDKLLTRTDMDGMEDRAGRLALVILRLGMNECTDAEICDYFAQ